MTIQYPFPAAPEEFESLCLRLYREHWDVPSLQKYGRRGDGQSGGDLLGTDSQGRVCFIQCKKRDWDRTLTQREIEADIEAAKGLHPQVQRYGIATTAKRDPELQAYVAQKNVDHRSAGLFTVELASWDDIIELLNQYEDVAASIYGLQSLGQSSRGLVTLEERSTAGVTVARIQDSVAEIEEGTTGGLHGDIDEAGKYLTSNRPDTALEFLERLRRREWDRATSREKYRICANIGHAHRLLGNQEEAARSYVQAKQFQPEDENARWMEALAHVLRGDPETAHELARQVMHDFPEFPKATSVWVASAPSDIPFGDIEKAVPVGQRADAEVAINLATQAARRSEWGHAEGYARAALEKEPGWAQASIALAEILFESTLARRGNARFGVLNDHDRARVTESAELLSAVIQGLPSYEGTVFRARLQVNLAGMYQLLGREQEARDTVVLAHSAAPDDAEVQVAYASHLIDRGNLDEAISLLRSRRAPSARGDLILAQALAFRRQANDQQDAAELLHLTDERLAQIDEQAPELRTEWARTLLRLYLHCGECEAAADVLAGKAGAWLRPEERLVWEADTALTSGDKDTATEKAREAHRHLSADSHPVTLRQLAVTFHRLGLYPESLQLWLTITPPDKVSLDSDYLLDCAQRTGHEDVILDFCRRLREAGIFNPRYIRGEIAILQEVSPRETLDLLGDLLDAPLEDEFRRELRAWRSYIALQVGKRELADFDLGHLPAVSDLAEPRTGRATVEVLRQGPEPMEAVRYAYEVFRKFPDELDAHLAVVTSLLEAKVDIPEPECVKPGTAVKYRESDSGKEDWVIIEGSPPIHPALGEQLPDTPIASALLGKAKGDTCVLREQPRRTGSVLDIVDKYVHRFRECLSGMENRFSGGSPIFAMHVPTKEDGTPDAEKALEQMKEVVGDPAQAERFYQERMMPLNMLGRYTGGSVFEVVQRLAGSNETSIKCCVGARDEREAAFTAIETASTMVIDASALGTLYLLRSCGVLDVGDFLKAAPYGYTVSEHALTMLRQLRQFRFQPNGDRLFLDVSREKTRVHAVEAGEMRRAKEDIEHFIETLEANTTVAAGTNLVTKGEEDRKLKEAAEQLLGKEGLDSALLATTPGHVLWTDDLAIAAIVCPGLGVRRTWTQAVFFWLAERGFTAQDQEQKVTMLLLRGGYVFTSLRADHVVTAGDQSEWDVDALEFQPFVSYFASPSLDLPSRFSLASNVLKDLWQRRALRFGAEAVTFRILAALGTVRDGQDVIDGLLRHADGIFGLDVMAAEAFKQAVQAWNQTNRGIILP